MEPDYTAIRPIVQKIIAETLARLPSNQLCLNVNIPRIQNGKLRGIKACRQARGFWKEEFEKRTDPRGFDYYWLTGKYENLEPQAEDTDEWALSNNYASITPIKADATCYQTLDSLKKWNFAL